MQLHMSVTSFAPVRGTSGNGKDVDRSDHRAGKQRHSGVGDDDPPKRSHIPLESIVNKYYGESEKRLNAILKLCNEIDNCIIFIDEAGLDLNAHEQIDAVVTNRDNDQMNEATRRLLSVLLRFLEGFDNSNLNKDSVNTKRSILICATNRKQDLDAVRVFLLK